MSDRGPDGRFLKGKKPGPGRPPGTRQSIFEKAFEWFDWTKAKGVLEVLLQNARQGDIEAARILLARFLPERLGVEIMSKHEHQHLHVYGVLPLDWTPPPPQNAVPPELWLDEPPEPPTVSESQSSQSSSAAEPPAELPCAVPPELWLDSELVTADSLAPPPPPPAPSGGIRVERLPPELRRRPPVVDTGTGQPGA
jgi:hypothetical protein